MNRDLLSVTCVMLVAPLTVLDFEGRTMVRLGGLCLVEVGGGCSPGASQEGRGALC